jgi:D-glycero-D-manno-heptose 1,7-bisphosphate phosphatase
VGELRGLIILDRDGVLNRMLGVPHTPTYDSPMNTSQVELCEGAAEVLRDLTQAGYGLAIATNQPAAAKGKTTRAELEDVHRLVVDGVSALGGKILSSHICWHRAEDGCLCRKPKPGLLEEAIRINAQFARSGHVWMVGDRPVDVMAGAALGLSTAFLSNDSVDEMFSSHSVRPTFHGADLRDFRRLLFRQSYSE